MFTNLSVAVRRRHGMCKTDVIVTWSSSWQPWRHGRHSSWCGRPASVQCIWRHKGWKERSARGGGGETDDQSQSGASTETSYDVRSTGHRAS